MLHWRYFAMVPGRILLSTHCIQTSSSRFSLNAYQKRKFKKAKIIFNPLSGRGVALPFLSYKCSGIKRHLPAAMQKPGLFLQLIEHSLREFGINADSLTTESPEEATQATQRYVQENVDLIIAVGGDGTINAVVNGMIGSDATLGIIPSGTINVLGLQLDLPDNLQESCRLIARGETACLDVGQVNQHYFTCMAGIGFDAYVIKSTNSKWKRIIGAIAYLLVGLDSLFTYPFKTIHMRIDDQEELKKGYFVVVGNVKFYASNLALIPQADPADGYLDVCIFKKKNFFRYLKLFLPPGRGLQKAWVDVEYHRCRKISFPEARHLVQLDGEYFGRTPVEINVLPAALRVVI
jgi:YegS/Rv2252/BmrU family lipid kinase